MDRVRPFPLQQGYLPGIPPKIAAAMHRILTAPRMKSVNDKYACDARVEKVSL